MTRPKMTYEVAANLLNLRGITPDGDNPNLEYEPGLSEMLVELNLLEYKQKRLIEKILDKAKSAVV